jgi:chromosome segregation ATPase
MDPGETHAPAYEPGPTPSGADPEAEQEMPYLFRKGAARPMAEPGIFYPQPLGDAVVPGGAAHSPDADTLKKYLMLREQDVSVLSSQFRAARAQLTETEQRLRDERARAADLTHTAEEQRRRIEAFEREKAAMAASYQAEIDELKFQAKARIDKAKLLEAQVREAAEEMERIKERVRVDIRKIRVREKELENRLEIMKKDSEALIGARESKIIELKRKLDVLEFNMDLLQDQNSKEKEVSSKLRERLSKAAQVVRVAAALAEEKEAS